MRGLSGLVLLAGIGVALFVYLPTPVDSGISPGRVQPYNAARFAALPRRAGTPLSRPGAFSPSIALSMPARAAPRPAGRARSTAPSPASAPPIADNAQMVWQTVVTRTPAPIEPNLDDPDARRELVVAIQQQLRRVGCYRGRQDGAWEDAVKDAMKRFTDRVNALLPLDQPDHIQLALIQSHGDGICGACPASQALSASGRCVGLPVTQATVATPKEVLPWKGSALFRPVPTTVPSAKLLPGRMAIGGPVPTSVDALPDATSVGLGTAALRSEAVAPETSPAHATAAEPPVTAAAQTVRPSRNSRRAGRNHTRRFAGGAAQQRARSSRRAGSGTPRHNLLLSLGGVY